MDIEMKERRWIKCSSLKKNILYQPVLCKKTHKEEMKVEGERVKKTSLRPSKPKLGGTRLMLKKK